MINIFKATSVIILLFTFIGCESTEQIEKNYDEAKVYSEKAYRDTLKSSKEVYEKTSQYTSEKSVIIKKETDELYKKSKLEAENIYINTKDYAGEKYKKFMTKDVTFESFYREDTSLSWIIALSLTAVAIASVIITAGASTPAVVTSFGTWIGGLGGLHGAAATSYGLALLGGGSVASGGFGILGGSVLLTGAFIFGTETIADYAIEKTFVEYDYSKFSKASKNMLTLPLPKNDSGSELYTKSINILSDIDLNVPLSSEVSQKNIAYVIAKLHNASEVDVEKDQLSRREALLSLLYFISNNYEKSLLHSKNSIELAKEAKITYTLPSFIHATSSLYTERLNINYIINTDLRYSMLEEPENPLSSLMIAVFMDRLMYRLEDGSITYDSLNQVYLITKDSILKDDRLKNYTMILSRYFMRIKIEQQKISSLTQTSNTVIKKSKEVLTACNKSFDSYKTLVNGSKLIILDLESISDNDENQKKLIEFQELNNKYHNDIDRLRKLIEELELYQETIKL